MKNRLQFSNFWTDSMRHLFLTTMYSLTSREKKERRIREQNADELTSLGNRFLKGTWKGIAD